jgi:hypothetical protein
MRYQWLFVKDSQVLCEGFGLSTTTQRGLTISGSLKVPLKSQTKMVPGAG